MQLWPQSTSVGQHWQILENRKGNERLQQAAKMCHKKDILIQIYENVIKESEKLVGFGPRLELELATVYQIVFPDYKKAKAILYEIIDGNTGARLSADQQEPVEGLEFVSTARLNLTGILMNEFRTTNVPE